MSEGNGNGGALSKLDKGQVATTGNRPVDTGLCRFDARGRFLEWDNAGLATFAGILSRSQVVPKQYQDKPNDCFVACQQAAILNIAPLVYMQNSSVVHGKPAPDGKLIAALLKQSGAIKGRIRYAYEYDKGGRPIACTASAIDAETGETVSAKVDQAMVDGEGWKSNSKWKNMPEQMFAYRSATFLVRRHFAEVLFGLNTSEELEDAFGAEERGSDPVERLRRIGEAIPEKTETRPSVETEAGANEPWGMDEPGPGSDDDEFSAEEEARIQEQIARESGDLFPA